MGAPTAGCAEHIVVLPTLPAEAYQIGQQDQRPVSVGVSVRGRATTLYLGEAATKVLARLRVGEIIVGPNLFELPGPDVTLTRQPDGTYYATAGSQRALKAIAAEH